VNWSCLVVSVLTRVLKRRYSFMYSLTCLKWALVPIVTLGTHFLMARGFTCYGEESCGTPKALKHTSFRTSSSCLSRKVVLRGQARVDCYHRKDSCCSTKLTKSDVFTHSWPTGSQRFTTQPTRHSGGKFPVTVILLTIANS